MFARAGRVKIRVLKIMFKLFAFPISLISLPILKDRIIEDELPKLKLKK